MKAEITTVAKLREALLDINGDAQIWAQVCSADGLAWSMQATIGDIHSANPRKLVIALRHPDLQTLPEWPSQSADPNE